MMSDKEENRPFNEDEASNEEDAPFPTDTLPPDFVVENVLVLTEEQQRHCVTFYQVALTAFITQASNGSMMMREKYVMIRDVLLQVQQGGTLGALRRAGYLQMNAWAKKFALIVPSESSMVVERIDIPKRKLNQNRRGT